VTKTPSRFLRRFSETSEALKVEVSRSGRLQVTATLEVTYTGPSGTSADAGAEVRIHGATIATSLATLQAGSTQTLPIQAVVSVHPGEREVELGIGGRYHEPKPGELIVTGVSLIATTLPAAPATLPEALG
jgi:hypothetical protein